MLRSARAARPCLVFVSIALVMGVATSRPARAESLYAVECASDAVVAALLQGGFVVAAREAGTCLVFADARLEEAARELGCATRLLDGEARGWEYYLTRGRPQRAPSGGFRRLAPMGDATLVAVAPGEVEGLLQLGLEVQRLFRRPLRLAQEKPRSVSPPTVATEAAIASLVASVSEESLQANVSWLENFGTRNAKKPGGRQAANWLAARFRGFGIQQVEVRTWSTVYAGNVVATIPGTTHPERIVLLGGHFDSYAVDSEFEPGADDNGSGTATLLELARLLARQRLASTVRFVAFSAEEWGLIGSEAYAATAAAQNENIVAMVNFDMLGYLANGDKRDLDLIIDDYGRNDWLLAAGKEAAATFVPDLPVIRGKLTRGRSDHESFWAHGYSAIFFFEDSNASSLFIHTPEDVVGLSYNDPTLHAQSTRVALALTATLAELQGGVAVTLQSFSANIAEGAVRLHWSLLPDGVGGLQGVDVQRSRQAGGPWRTRNATLLATSTQEFVDAATGAEGSWFYRLLFERRDGGREASSPVEVCFARAPSSLDAVVELEPGGPLQVRYRLGVATSQLHLGVYDVRGRLRRVLASGSQGPGDYVLTWDRRDQHGETLGNGVYFVQLRAPDSNQARKLVLRP